MSWERKSRQPCAGTFIRVILSCPPPQELAAILERYRGQPDALITVLEEMQDHYGYLPRQDSVHCPRLGFPLSRVYGVATFYNLFQLSPPGRYLVRICKGTACHVNRSADILARVQAQLGIGKMQPRQTAC